MFPECCARVIRLMKMLMKSHEIILRSTIILSPFVKTFQRKHTVQLCDPPLYHTTFLNLIHSYKFFHSAQRRKPDRVSSSVFFLPVNEDLWMLSLKMSLCVCVCVCRTGGSCGLMTHSGASCSPSSYWSSCSYGDRQPITRGKGGGCRGWLFCFFGLFCLFKLWSKASLSLCQVCLQSSVGWRKWGRGEGAHDEWGFRSETFTPSLPVSSLHFLSYICLTSLPSPVLPYLFI